MVQAVAWEVALFTSVLHAEIDRHPEWHAASHEALCTDPIGEFRRLFADLVLTWTAEAERFLRESNRAGRGYETARVAAEQPDRWKRRLSPEQVREIWSLLSQIRAPWVESLAGEVG